MLCRYGEDEVWQVYEYHVYAIKALSSIAMLSKGEHGIIVLAERNFVPVLFEKGKIVDWYWQEWEVIWRS